MLNHKTYKIIISIIALVIFALPVSAMIIFIDDSDLGVEANPEFSPSNISGLLIWYKADALSLNDNDPVGTWTDYSGNGNNATASGSNRPTYKTSILNGKPGLSFDGSDDYFTIGTPFQDPDYQYTFFIVLTKTTSTSIFPTLVSTSTLGNMYALFPYLGSTYIDNGYKNSSFVHDSTLTNYWSVLSLGNVAIPARVFRNGSEETLSHANQTYESSNFTYIGRRATDSTYANGYMYEILMYDMPLSDADRQSVESYLANKYGL